MPPVISDLPMRGTSKWRDDGFICTGRSTSSASSIDVFVAEKRDLEATRRFVIQELDHGTRPTEVSTDRTPAYPRVLDELLSSACHITERYANNTVEDDHGRLTSRLRSMRSLQ
jgi:transposase-like protein